MLYDEIQWGEIYIAQRSDTVIQFDLAPTRLVDTKPLIGSPSPSVRDRGNTVNQLTVGVLREHTSQAAARQFILEHAKQIEAADQETVRDLTARYFAFPPTTYLLKSAALASYPARWKGVSTTHIYTFTTGAIV